MVIGEQVLDLLANPPAPDLTGHHNSHLCEITEHLVRVQRAVRVAQWRELDEMVTRDGTRRAVDITADWLHAHSSLLLSDARTLVRMAVRMCASPTVLQAFASGAIGEREAMYIGDFLAHPPKSMDTDPSTGKPRPEADRITLRDAARDYLLLAAGSRDMRVLRAEGESLRDVLAGEISPGDDIDRNTLEIARYGRGRVRLRGDVDTETGENLLRALEPFMAACPDFDGGADKRSHARKRADALAELARRHQPAEADGEDGASAVAGTLIRPRISIHIPIELLFGDIPTHAETCRMIKDGRIHEVLDRTGRGWMSRMGSISLAAAKRLACDCELTMIGSDIHGAPLTVNTAKRFASKKHRIALEGRDRGCAFPSCDRPPDWTQAHHIIPWETRHETQIDGLTLLCAAHHVAVHHQGWEVAMGRTRFPVFRPPTAIDPLTRWRDSAGNLVDDPPGPEVLFADTG